jgi:hypothetical protein
MTSLFSVKPDGTGITLQPVLSANTLLPDGYSSITSLECGDATLLYAFNNSTKKTNIFQLTETAPFINSVVTGSDALNLFEWEILKSFVLGNKPFLLAYESKKGTFGIYEVNSDFSVSKPFTFVKPRNWPTKDFSEVTPFVSLGLLYVLCYSISTGTVAIFSIDMISFSEDGTPPLKMLNKWYHQWAKGWQDFAFFQLGPCNLFFKINKMKLNVNIDSILDDPTNGTIEVGSWLQDLLPNAMDISLVCMIPWANGEPYLATYDDKTKEVNVYRIHPDCKGWTNLNTTLAGEASQQLSYKTGAASFLLLY